MKKNQFFLIITIIILIFIFYLIKLENMNISMKFIILVVYTLTLILSYLRKEIMILLFLGCLFLFQYGRIVILPFFYKDIEMTFFYYIKFNLEIDMFVTELLFINLIGIFMGLIIPISSIRKIVEKEEKKKYVIFILIIIFISFYLKFSYEILKILKNYSYGDYYKIGMKSLNKSNLLEKICYNIFLFSIPFGLSLRKLSKKEKIFLIFINLFSLFLIVLRGTRSAFFSGICFTIWYLNKENIIKINIKKLFVIGTFLIVLIIFFENIRNNKRIDNFNIIKISKSVIYNQGTTGTFLCLLKEKPEIFEQNKIPYIFSNIIGFRSTKQDEETYQKIKNSTNVVLANRMSTSLNKDKWLLGNGMGGNYIIEMYDFGGKIGILILSLILTLFFKFVDKNYFYFSWLKRSFLIYIIPKFFLIPRNNYLIYISFVDLIKFIFVYFLILTLENIFIKRRKNE